MKILNNEVLKSLVVLLIDMQDNFVNTNEKYSIIKNQINVLRFSSKMHIPVIIINYEDLGNVVRELSDEIKKLSFDYLQIITKANDNAFIKTILEETLENLKAKHLLIMGVNACGCVYQTAITAIKKDFEIITSKDLIAGYHSNCLKKKIEQWYELYTTYVDNHKSILEE